MLVSRVSVSGCLEDGIFLGELDSTLVESCTVRTVGAYGIRALTIRDSSAIDCGNNAIDAFIAQDCYGSSSGEIGVSANTALNSYGSTSSSSSYGVYAETAENCSGYSSSSSAAVYAVASAVNCIGSSAGGGDGVFAQNAQNCSGYCSGTGDAIYASSALNCYGYCNGGGEGVFASNIATGCYGASSTGAGISAYIANSCLSSTGDSDISYKYNMP